MKAVVGLGNPGRAYANTPHSIGFDIVERLAVIAGAKLRSSLRFDARLARTVLQGGDVMLVEPQTYMNASGKAVSSVLRYHRIEPVDMIVVLDDADLEVGRIRIRVSGSSGGHKGLQSVAESIGSTDFVRVRVGIGRGGEGVDLVRHVLEPFSAEERLVMNEVVEESAGAVLSILSSGVDRAMNTYNARRIGRAEG
ncbi:MAG: aminoacyl-tRNA hydrolase [bacterium]